MRNKRASAAVFAGLFAALLAAGTAKADSSITNIKLHFVDEVEEGQLSWPKEVIAPENGTYEIADVEEIEMAEEIYEKNLAFSQAAADQVLVSFSRCWLR